MVRRPQPTLTRLLLAAVSLLAALGSSADAQTCAAIACGDTMSGALSVSGEMDCYQFSAGMGETVSITTQVTAGVFQPCWRLQGPTGPLDPAVCGQATRTLPAAGTYTIEVFDSNDDQSGAYDLYVLAMCHYRMGDAARAKDCFDRAVRWQQQATLRPAQVEELNAFQAEAAELLGRTNQP